MLTSIHIQGFKGFKDTQITPLRKVNLILGGQNVGKTSLLEAVYLGAGPVGNVLNLPAVFRSAEGGDAQRFLDMTLKKTSCLIELGLGDELPGESNLVTAINFSGPTKANWHEVVSFSLGGGELVQYINSDRIRHLYSDPYGIIPVEPREFALQLFSSPLVISVNPPTQSNAVQLFDTVVLKRKKRTLLDALRRIEPRLEDMHSLSPDGELRVYLELSGLANAVPLPQLGHGFSRLLYLYCSLLVTDAKLALIDEVENGIHFASLPILFKGIQDMAATQGVQTLMTTHSWDCIRAAYKTFADADALQDFQLIRLEREDDNIRAVVINGEMLGTVMEAGYEVR